MVDTGEYLRLSIKERVTGPAEIGITLPQHSVEARPNRDVRCISTTRDSPETKSLIYGGEIKVRACWILL